MAEPTAPAQGCEAWAVNTRMTVSAGLISELKGFEKFVATAEPCPAGVPTIGWGHTKGVTWADVRRGTTITKAQGGRYLRSDLRLSELAVMRCIKVNLNQNRFDALVSFTFNVGAEALQNSTLCRLLNQGQYSAVPFQMSRWKYGNDPETGDKVIWPGLVSRRAVEGARFARAVKVEGVMQQNRPEIPKGIISPAPVREERESLHRSRTSWGSAVSMAGTVTSTASGAIYAVEPLTERVSWLPGVLAALVAGGIAAALLGAALAFYARRDDHKKAMR